MARKPPPDYDKTPVTKIDPSLTDPDHQEKLDRWMDERKRLADPQRNTTHAGLATSKGCKEIQPGVYLDLLKPECPSPTCKHKYRYECETGDEYGRTCGDHSCNWFCT